MLVLERKLQEGFWIDGRIFVKVIGISKRRVKLGIEAPPELSIMRTELRPNPNGTGPASDTQQVLSERRRSDKAGTAAQPE